MLAEIGIVYGQQEVTWQDNYELIKAYVEKHHRLPTGKNSIKIKIDTRPVRGSRTRRFASGTVLFRKNEKPYCVTLALDAEGNS